MQCYTSKTEIDIQHNKLYWGHSLIPNLLSRNETPPVAVKNYARTDVKFFLPV